MLGHYFLGIISIFWGNDHNSVPIPSGITTMPSTGFSFNAISGQTVLDQFPGFSTRDSKGEGCHGATTMTGADAWISSFCRTPAKCGQPPPMSQGSQTWPTPSPAVVKRSFQRACRRAIRDGQTGYHGRLWSVTDFPAALVQKLAYSPSVASAPEHAPRRSHHRVCSGRFSILTWNPGGLSQSRFFELKSWLRIHPTDIVVVPETKWSFNRTWQDDSWAFIHSATDEFRSGGLLVMISRRMIHPDAIGYEPIMPGRLLHIRLHMPGRAVDVLAVYQHVYQPTTASVGRRSSFWHKMDEYLTKLPRRNLFLCAGDFNCGLPSAAPWTGPSVFLWRGHRYPNKIYSDQQSLMDILQRHGLVALNSWSVHTGPSFINGDTATKIDHILTRLHTCDGLSEEAVHLPDADIVPLNQSHHIPIRCTIRKQFTAFQVHPQVTSCTYAQRAQCRRAAMQDTESWNQLSCVVQDSLSSNLNAQSDACPIATLHQQVSPQFHTIFQNPRVSRTDHHHQLRNSIRTKWQHKRVIPSLKYWFPKYPIRSVFQVGFHWSRYHALQRQQQKAARQAKRARFTELCAEATTAAIRHDAHAMFAIINKFSPKKPLVRARLRTADGCIADQYQSHTLMTAFVRDMWQGPTRVPAQHTDAPGVPFSLHDLTLAIASAHMNKSVAQPFLPAAVWRSAPLDTAEFLMHHLQRWWGVFPPHIPTCWKDSWLFFLPKIGKPNTHPEHLRPISLLEPLGKIVMGLLASQLQTFLLPRLTKFPHFGFLPGRAATDAILRVSMHCRLVRKSVHDNRRTVHQQIAACPRRVICGGVSLFLDLTRAFDCVVRSILFQHLSTIHTPATLLCLIRTWHECTHYNLIFQGQTYPIPVGKGVRQGCKIAPHLWLAYMDKFLYELVLLTGPEWIQQSITLYADDIHIGCQFTSAQTLRLHL